MEVHLKTASFAFLLFIMGMNFSISAEGPLVKEESGKLVYRKTESRRFYPGIFPTAAIKAGGVSFPETEVAITLSPKTSGDDTGRIQEALDKVARKSSEKRPKAVLLKKGTYRVADTLTIKNSGVVLKGEGQNEDGTVIIATGNKKRTLIQIRGDKYGKAEIPGSRNEVADDYVPVGARTFKLESTKGLSKGDEIFVYRKSNQQWIKKLGMDKLNRGPKDKVKNWTPKYYSFAFERRIVEKKGNSITIDAPIVFSN